MKQDSSLNILPDLGKEGSWRTELMEGGAGVHFWLDPETPALGLSDSTTTLHTSLQERAADLVVCTKFSHHLSFSPLPHLTNEP